MNLQNPYKITIGNNRDRVEKREAQAINNVSFLEPKEDRQNIKSVGMIHSTRFINEKVSAETISCISSVKLTPTELLKYVRAEWSAESMHWLPDVNLQEDKCRATDETSQKSLNVLRKSALNLISVFQQNSAKKTAKSKIMSQCLLDTKYLLNIIGSQNN